MPSYFNTSPTKSRGRWAVFIASACCCWLVGVPTFRANKEARFDFGGFLFA